MIEAGQQFPQFSLSDQNGRTRSLSDYADRWLVVYFYPKDDTPGCTIQGKSFTATRSDFEAAGIEVVGVSQDDAESHKNFSDKFAFTIDLLADPGSELLRACGVGQTEYKGTMFWDRTSFVIDPSGTVRTNARSTLLCCSRRTKTYAKVSPQGHEQVLLEDIREMQTVG